MSLLISFLDIKHGNSTFIKTPNKMNIIFDCGSNLETGKNAFSLLGDEILNYLIISHPHKDHISGLIDSNFKKPKTLMRNRKIPEKYIEEKIEESDNEKDKKIFRKYLDLNKRFNAPIDPKTYAGDPNNNGNVVIETFTPPFKQTNDLNYYSIATYIEYNNFKVLLMGDNTIENINKLLENSKFKRLTKNINVLLAPHHGRKSCYSVNLMNHLKPDITIISDDSEKNDESAIDYYTSKSNGWNVLKNNQIVKRKCLTTRNDGDIILSINNEMNIICLK